MNDRLVSNLQRMSAIWADKLTEAKVELDGRLWGGGTVLLRSRARFRQCGLCLAGVRDEVEYLTGVENATRQSAFEQYSVAAKVLIELKSGAAEPDGCLGPGPEQARSSASDSPRRAEIEAAERAADLALLEWATR